MKPHQPTFYSAINEVLGVTLEAMTGNKNKQVVSFISNQNRTTAVEWTGAGRNHSNVFVWFQGTATELSNGYYQVTVRVNPNT